MVTVCSVAAAAASTRPVTRAAPLITLKLKKSLRAICQPNERSLVEAVPHIRRIASLSRLLVHNNGLLGTQQAHEELRDAKGKKRR